ncbi:metal-dependent hydrolase family protein [Pseudoalteromonas tunicata]|uniref:metal-dependent hydrolase family protein n=1 Tax=Pseudoalteromonas tunicata TaxID=314281 RepID=UPI00273E2732|nr:amidohydrolase family protein [Pseudoalteromonas tunicata]MDP4983081.1 amidohydrolase family protein [Pseudoalteromonas tunicata]
MTMSKFSFGVLSTVMLAISPALFAQVDAVIYGGTVLTVPGKSPLKEQTLILEDGKISAIHNGYRTLAQLKLTDVPVIDLKDSYVMPGLIDMHVHLTFERDPTANPHVWLTQYDADFALASVPYLEKTLNAGFTTVRDLGGSYKVIFPLKRAVNNQTIVGPRIFAAGDFISATGGHGDLHGYRHDVTELVTGGLGICDGADDCRRAVREVIKSGADVIKITATGGVLSNTAAGVKQQFTDQELEAIVSTAHNLGRKVTAHAHGTDGINAAIRAGVDSIEHGSYLDKESIRLFNKHQTYLVPTLLAGATVSEEALTNPNMPAAIVAKVKQVAPVMEQAFRTALKNNVNIAFGTDSGVSQHGQNAKEFALMVKYGMSPKDAIVSATLSAATLLGMQQQLGSLEVGKFADIIALKGDPEQDISELSRVSFVMKNAVIYKNEK